VAAWPTLAVGVSSLPEIKSLNESSQGVSGPDKVTNESVSLNSVPALKFVATSR
jgi:hypothetical protein